MPIGILHAIGKGLIISEIQQNFNTILYRVYDYDCNGRYSNGRVTY